MTSRVSIPLVICIGAAAIAVIGLIVPIRSSDDASPPPAATAVADAVPANDSQQSANSGVAAISIANFAFDIGVIAQPGQVVEVTNLDAAPHTLTSTDGLFGSGTVPGGVTASFVAPAEAGTYAFFCELHPSMTGTLRVGS